jgi:hypothetical protein
MARFQVLSVNDDRDFCECCGKTGLKRVVFIQDNETGEVKHFGTSCAMSPVKGFGIDKEIKAAISRANDKAKMLNILAHQAYKRAGGSYVANPDGYSWRAADPALHSQCRQQEAARGFNY